MGFRLGKAFFSLYLALILTFIGTTWLLDKVWSSHIERDVKSYASYRVVLEAIDDRLRFYPKDQWASVLSQSESKYGWSLSLVGKGHVKEHYQHLKPLAGAGLKIFVVEGQAEFFHNLNDTNFVLKLGPVPTPRRPQLEGIVRVLVLLFVALVVFFWVLPLSKDLDNLQAATQSFGQGDFNTVAKPALTPGIQPMVETFNMMAARINRLIGAHKELTNAVSHELRTPVARTKFSLDMLKTLDSSDKSRRYIDLISVDIMELESLIHEMLAYASFESDQPNMHWNKLSVLEVINSQQENFSQFEGQINVATTCPELEADFDRHFIERALSNLLTNAVKYGQGEILISLSSVNNQCQISVEDNGEGVDDEFKVIIFDAFSRGDKSRGKDTGGFGLGLAIVGKVMEWHNGTVTVNDSSLGGAKFTLSWPIEHHGLTKES